MEHQLEGWQRDSDLEKPVSGIRDGNVLSRPGQASRAKAKPGLDALNTIVIVAGACQAQDPVFKLSRGL